MSQEELQAEAAIDCAMYLRGKMLGTLYLGLLLVELAFTIYDGVFDDVSIHKWIRVVILMLGIWGYYCWLKHRESLLPRPLWIFLLIVVAVWFFAYLPWHTWNGLKDVPDVDVMALILPYVAFYVLHAPMLFGLYSCAFRKRLTTVEA